MIDAWSCKPAVSILADDVTNTTVNGTAIDTAGFNFAVGVFAVETTTGNLSVIKVQESDASGSGFADVSGLSFTALGATDDNKHVVGIIDLRDKKRYLRWVVTEDNTGTADAIAGLFFLGGANEAPVDAAGFGADELLSA